MDITIRNATQADLDFVRLDSIDPSAKKYPDWQLNGWTKTFIIDGDVVAVGGVVVYWEGVGEGWFCMTKKTLEHKVVVMRHMKRIIEQAFVELNLWRIQVSERVDNPQSIQMAETLGFVREGLMKKYLPDGKNAWLYAIVR